MCTVRLIWLSIGEGNNFEGEDPVPQTSCKRYVILDYIFERCKNIQKPFIYQFLNLK